MADEIQLVRLLNWIAVCRGVKTTCKVRFIDLLILSSTAKWFKESELRMNIKQGKTEVLLFGASKKIAHNTKDFEIYANKSKVSVTKECKYVGVPANSSLNMTSSVDKCYKKASSRLNLLAKVKFLMDVNVVKSIYQTMVLLAFTYFGLNLLCITATLKDKLASLHKRAERIVKSIEIPSVSRAKQKRAY